MEPLYLGIDLGTSGVRICAIDHAECIVGSAATALPPPRQQGPAIDQDPELWWQAVETAMALLADAVDLQRVIRVAVDGTSGTLLVVNDAGMPCSRGIMYHDARSTAEAKRIAAVAPVDSGAHGPCSALAKLMHLHAIGLGVGSRHAMHQADWIAGRLAGRFGISDENNALKLGYDPVNRTWPSWIDTLKIPRALLPQVLVPGSTIGPIQSAVAAQLGLPTTVEICAGTTDGVASFLAARATDVGDAVTSLGTTLVVKVLSEHPIFAADQGVYSHRLGSRWLVGGASNSGGAALLVHFNAQQMAELTPRLNPGRPTGLDFYPLPKPGERFPIADPTLPPRVSPRPADDVQFFQGLLEGIAAIEARAYMQLTTLGAPHLRRVITIGGGSRNPAWTVIRQGILGVPVSATARAEASFGTALLALHGAPP